MPTSEKNGKQPGVLIPEVKIQARLMELAQEINYDYRGKEVVAICILKGSFVFFSELIRKLDMPMTCEFLGISTYGNKMVSSGEVKVTLDINEPLEGKHVIVFDDIADTGLTLSYIMNNLRTRKPASIKCCCLMSKPDSLRADFEIDYVGFKIGREFVVGYGIDYAGQYRNLPYIGFIDHAH